MRKKIIAGILLVLVICLTGIGFLARPDIRIVRSITIDAPVDYIFEELNEAANWHRWSYWHSRNDEPPLWIDESRSGLGMTADWNDSLTTGRLIVIKTNYPDTLEAIISRNNSEAGTAWCYLNDAVAGIELTMGVELAFPDSFLERFKTLLFRKSDVRRVIDFHLARLKELAEAKPIFDIPIATESLAPIYYVFKTAPAQGNDPDAIIKVQMEIHRQLEAMIPDKFVLGEGFPLSIVDRTIDGVVTVAYGIPIQADAPFPERLIRQLYSGWVVRATHHGDISNISRTHDEIKRYMQYKDFISNGEPWEVYRVGPATTTDRETWVTDVYHPVEKIIF